MTKKELRKQAGQLLIMGFDGTAMAPPLEKLLGDVQPGGVILFARNLVSAGQCHDLLSACRKVTDASIFTCIDLEGGTVDRLHNVIAPAPSEKEVARTGSRKLFRRHGELLGAEARALGFNVDFAPVSDLGLPVSEKVLGPRTVSADAKETVIFVCEFLRGLKSSGVLGCGKHFPGLGESNLDSHLDLPCIQKSWKKLWQEDLYPYRALHRQFPFVMAAHAAYPEVTGDKTPASLSKKWLKDVLRKKIGYRGIILSDDLEMGGVLAAGPVAQVAVETLRAGADMYLVCHKEEMVRTAYEAVVRETERDTRFARQVILAAKRVENMKHRNPSLRRIAPRPTNKTVDRLGKQLEAFQSRLAKAAH